MSDQPLSPSRQVIFHQMLVASRKTVLIDAMSEALASINPVIVKEQILRFVPAAAQKTLAASGIRDEHVFPVPIVLEKKPTLIGYYRLLLGISQKRFYRSGTGMSPFKSMETHGIINTRNPPDLGHFCRVMAENLGALIGHISPKITARDISELSLLTLGAQLYGSNNNTIGKQATLDVFLSVTEIVKKYIVSKDSTKIIVTNASKRKVIIALAADPAPLPCASETAYRKCDECVDDRFCGTKMVMREVRDAMAGILDNVTLAQVCQRMDDARAKVEVEAGEALMYYI